MTHQLIVLPDDTAKPIVDAIDGATKALNIRMFLFTDTTLIDAVIAAHKRGVKVRVMLNPARRSGESENEEARKPLTDAGIEVHDSNPAFDLTHQKSMVIDDKIGFVESLNWEPKDLTKTRDYAIVTTHGHEVAEMVACFDADWEHKDFKPQPDSALIWCPNNGRQRVAEFIDATQHTLWLQNERYQDQVIIERLVRAVRRGVKVHILAKPPHSLKPDKLIEGVGGLRILQDVGAKVHTLKHLKLHAKMLLRRQQAGDHRLDQHRAGQLRLAARAGHRDRRRRGREAAREGRQARLGRCRTRSTSSDAALLADLKKREGLDPDKLVLYEDSEHWGYHHNGHHHKHGGKVHEEHQGRL